MTAPSTEQDELAQQKQQAALLLKPESIAAISEAAAAADVEPEDIAAINEAAAAAAVGAVPTGETVSRLAKLDSLLEKAGMYSSFLFSNMTTAASIAAAPSAAQDDDNDNDDDATTTRSGKRKASASAAAASKRTRTRTAKKPVGATKLAQMQRETDELLASSGSFQQPALLTGGVLRDYQLAGIQWLCNLFENGLNGILADEMGLGKTIQVIGLIAHLKALGVRGPYLITAPLSTLMNWQNEFTKWAPTIPTLVYHGTMPQRRLMRKQQLKAANRTNVDFPVVITSYEVILADARSFTTSGYIWKYIVIDEGHRLKNMDCKLVRELKRARSENRLLLTGTPLQNNLVELWALLNFILPDVFDDLELFESWFSFTPDAVAVAQATALATKAAGAKVATHDVLVGDKKAEVVSKLHEILRPFLLRRLKVDVVAEMPSKTEVFVYCPMAPAQRVYYNMILDGTLRDVLEAKYGKFRGASFKTNGARNRAMQLRKCCNHPYLFDEPVSGASGELTTDERLVEASGKLQVLDKMLAKLYADGHKVLIFSQMTRVLDILEDFLALRQYNSCRLDGTTKLQDRQDAMDAFNQHAAGPKRVGHASQSTDESNLFCFLLSTRAGGLGINLISADTVIFFDSDWNPQQDNQAQDRCHRIGQTKEIAVYRLVTENSFENRMIARAIEKRKLERVVIQRGHFKHQHQLRAADAEAPTALTNDELEELLRDDVRIRAGVESGGIQDDELWRILDRETLVKSFVTHKDRRDVVDSKGDDDLLAFKGDGYEVVDNAPTAGMEAFTTS